MAEEYNHERDLAYVSLPESLCVTILVRVTYLTNIEQNR